MKTTDRMGEKTYIQGIWSIGELLWLFFNNTTHINFISKRQENKTKMSKMMFDFKPKLSAVISE